MREITQHSCVIQAISDNANLLDLEKTRRAGLFKLHITVKSAGARRSAAMFHAHDAFDTLPRLPSRVTSARAETPEDVAFLSGDLAREKPSGQAAWRHPGGGKLPGSIDPLIELVSQDTDIMLCEMRDALETAHGVRVHHSSVDRTLGRAAP